MAGISSVFNPIKLLTGNRIGYAIFRGAGAMIRSFLRTFYVLWLEVTGFLFGAFTLWGGTALVHQYKVKGWAVDPQRFWVIVAFTLVCGWFTLTSFFRARKTAKVKN